MYKINTFNGDVVRISDNYTISVPYNDPMYLEYADWINSGNSPTEFSQAPAPTVPEAVSKFQAKAALLESGLLDQVETLMVNPVTPALARLAWQDAQEFKRNSPTVAGMAAALGLTDAQLDSLFVLAGSIVA